MRYISAVAGLILTIGLCWMLDGIQIKGMPLPFGRALDPFHGIWQNLEPQTTAWPDELKLEGLQGPVKVAYDSLRIPHIFAENAHDLYFMQGYVTARDRLWQMEFQTHAAAGRLSEIIDDPRVLALDRAKRRTGMVYAAEQSVKAMEADPVSKEMVHAYADGVNAWIASLSYADYPIEYKMLGYAPEPWTTLKSAILLKFMAWDLTGRSEDFENTNALLELGWPGFQRLYPDLAPETEPIVPKGTAWNFDTLKVQGPDSFAPQAIAGQLTYPQPEPMNGSNNWVVAGSKTANGRPILCNDPHLSLRLPSIWYEIQLHMPGMNVYGVSLPGSPAVIIGFNENITWGVTNASRDVLDWYGIEFQDASRKAYKHNGQWLPCTERLEVIKRRFSEDFVDTVRYTQHGPVVYDRSFRDKDSLGPLDVAMRWAGHDSSNEVMTFWGLNRAKNYDDYRKAISKFTCPGQNFIFASSAGDIAITQQGRFPLKWEGQGQFVMDGSNPLHKWQAYIPFEQNPTAKNPERGFLFSSNQHATDSDYPYPIYGYYDYTRNLRIASALKSMNGITVQDMFKLQNDNFNEFAARLLPKVLPMIQKGDLSPGDLDKLKLLTDWNLMNDHDQVAPSIFQAFSDQLYALVWDDNLARYPRKGVRPERYLSFAWMADTLPLPEVDDIATTEKEDLAFMVNKAFKAAMKDLSEFEQTEGLDLTWQNYNNVHVQHLSRQAAFSYFHLPVGGNAGIVNANRKNNGASWRMVVEMGEEINAYGVFPGGQSGNPGSPYYGRSIADWAAGRYHKLHFLKPGQLEGPALSFTQTFQPN